MRFDGDDEANVMHGNSFNFFLYNGKAEGGAGEEWAMEIKTELWCFENKRLRRP